jgi:hypothetical protein
MEPEHHDEHEKLLCVCEGCTSKSRNGLKVSRATFFRHKKKQNEGRIRQAVVNEPQEETKAADIDLETDFEFQVDVEYVSEANLDEVLYEFILQLLVEKVMSFVHASMLTNSDQSHWNISVNDYQRVPCCAKTSW